jgi:hypothetical protein
MKISVLTLLLAACAQGTAEPPVVVPAEEAVPLPAPVLVAEVSVALPMLAGSSRVELGELFLVEAGLTELRAHGGPTLSLEGGEIAQADRQKFLVGELFGWLVSQKPAPEGIWLALDRGLPHDTVRGIVHTARAAGVVQLQVLSAGSERLMRPGSARVQSFAVPPAGQPPCLWRVEAGSCASWPL